MRLLLAAYWGSDRPTGVRLAEPLGCESMVRGTLELGATVHKSAAINKYSSWRYRGHSERKQVPIHGNEAGTPSAAIEP